MEDPRNLPEGWTWSTLDEVCERVEQLDPRKLPDREFKYVDISSVDNKWNRITENKSFAGADAPSRARKPIQENDVLFATVRTYLRNIVLVPQDYHGEIASTGFCVLRSGPDLDARFLFRYVLTDDFVHEVSEMQRGISYPAVTDRDVYARSIPLPPLPEQRRIVEKIERLLEQSRTAREALDRIPSLLKRFRQSVLTKAFRGELTERDPNDEPAELLLSAPAGKQSPKKRAGRLWGSGVVPGLTNKERRSLPETWAWAKVGDLGERREETVQVGPMSMRSKDLGVSGVPVLNVGCIRWGYIDERKLDFMPDSLAGAFERYRVKTGDVMFTRSGTVGRSAVVQPTQEGWLMTFHLLRVRVSPAKCLPEYLQLVFQGARHVGRQTSDASIGTTRAGFNTNLLAMLDVPLAPLGEQRRIVDEVKALFAQADAIEQAAVKARRRAEQVDQAVLARAFRGEL
jgi:type I restriction enzyme S subunit